MKFFNEFLVFEFYLFMQNKNFAFFLILVVQISFIANLFLNLKYRIRTCSYSNFKESEFTLLIIRYCTEVCRLPHLLMHFFSENPFFYKNKKYGHQKKKNSFNKEVD